LLLLAISPPAKYVDLMDVWGVEPRKVAIGTAEVFLECDGAFLDEELRDWGEQGETPLCCTLPFVT
jgi:hypothetical protein